MLVSTVCMCIGASVYLIVAINPPYPLSCRLGHHVCYAFLSTQIKEGIQSTVRTPFTSSNPLLYSCRTDNIVSRLVMITIEAALPPALSAICDMITSATQIGQWS